MTKNTDLSNAEFKGTVVQSLSDIRKEQLEMRGDLSELKKSWLALEEGKVSDLLKRVGIIEGQKDGSKMTWEKVISIGALAVAVLAIFWRG